MLLGSLTKPMRTLSSNKLRLHTSGFLLVNFGHMACAYSHLFHLIENSDLVYLRYSLFRNYYDYTLVAILIKAWFHITVIVPAVVPAALPGTCLRQIFFNGNTCPRYRRQSACGTGRVELSLTFQAIPVPQVDENFNGNTHRTYRRQAIDMLITT